jgi:pimeloyl-ACP methyl ester carboxylesterase
MTAAVTVVLASPGRENDVDAYADDLLTLIEKLDLKDIMLVGHSTGGSDVARFCGRHGTSRVGKAVLVSAVTLVMVQSESNPNGLPISVFDGFNAAILLKERNYSSTFLLVRFSGSIALAPRSLRAWFKVGGMRG